MVPRRRPARHPIPTLPSSLTPRPTVVAALLLLALPLRAEAFSLRHAEDGSPVAWALGEAPIPVYLDAATMSAPKRALLLEALTGALEAWNGESALTLALSDGTPPIGVSSRAIVVRWDEAPWVSDHEQLAVTALAFDPKHGTIVGALVRVNDAYSWSGGTLPAGALALDGGFDLQSTLTHELGHAFGLAHSAVPGATMHLGTRAGEQGKRTLDPDDVAAIVALYGNPGAGTSEVGGCSSTRASASPSAPLVWIGLALLAVGRRRRRP